MKDTAAKVLPLPVTIWMRARGGGNRLRPASLAPAGGVLLSRLTVNRPVTVRRATSLTRFGHRTCAQALGHRLQREPRPAGLFFERLKGGLEGRLA
jgi:hypothetical protein